MNGGELKRRREDAGLTLADLAKDLGVSPQAVSAWENETRVFPARRLRKLEQALHPATEEWDSTGILVLSWH